MDRISYNQIIKSLVGNYGTRSFDETKSDVIFEKYKFLEDDKFRKIISEIVNTSKKAPTIADIEQVYKKLYKSDNAKKEYHEECKFCNNNGFINMEFQKGEYGFYTYPVLCRCKNALNFARTEFNTSDGARLSFKNNYMELIFPKFFEDVKNTIYKWAVLENGVVKKLIVIFGSTINA